MEGGREGVERVVEFAVEIERGEGGGKGEGSGKMRERGGGRKSELGGRGGDGEGRMDYCLFGRKDDCLLVLRDSGKNIKKTNKK